MSTHLTAREQERLDALRRYDIVDSDPEALYDDIAMIAARLCDAPYAAVCFDDETRCWFKAVWGLTLTEVPRSQWFNTGDTVRSDDVVTTNNHTGGEGASAKFGFYAGAPIVTEDGYVLGAVCVLDDSPRELTREQNVALQVLSRQVMSLLDLRRSTALLETASVKMQMLADRDAVTGLPTERMFRAQLRTEFQYARRHNQPLSLILFDIDGFTKLCMDLGSERCDEILKRIGRTVDADTRDYDLVARCGADEFAVLMRNCVIATARSVAHRIQERIRDQELARVPISVSSGVAGISPEMISSREIIERAREALYESRGGGRPAARAALPPIVDAIM